MAKRGVKEIVAEMATPIVESLGYELVEVTYAKSASGMQLTLFIYSKNGISLDDCEKVSRALDAPLDELNPTNDVSYTLNVSSLGLDRPIKTEADAKRNIGTLIDVKLYSQLDGKKLWTGVLQSCSQNGITIDVNGESKTFLFEQIALASPVINF